MAYSPSGNGKGRERPRSAYKGGNQSRRMDPSRSLWDIMMAGTSSPVFTRYFKLGLHCTLITRGPTLSPVTSIYPVKLRRGLKVQTVEGYCRIYSAIPRFREGMSGPDEIKLLVRAKTIRNKLRKKWLGRKRRLEVLEGREIIAQESRILLTMKK
jgi:hypothetical protein